MPRFAAVAVLAFTVCACARTTAYRPPPTASPPATAPEGGVLLRMRPPQGQVTRYRMTMDMFMLGGPLAAVMDTTQPFIRMQAVQTRTVSALQADTVTFRERVDSASMDFPAMPQVAAMAAEAGQALVGAETESRVTTRGRMLATRAIHTPEALREMGAADALNQMGGGQQFVFLLPEQAVAVGSSWTDSTSVTDADGDRFEIHATYRLDRVEGQAVTISLTGTMRGGSTSVPVNLNVTGEVHLDLATGRLSSTSLRMHGSVSAEGMEVPVRMQITLTQM